MLQIQTQSGLRAEVSRLWTARCDGRLHSARTKARATGLLIISVLSIAGAGGYDVSPDAACRLTASDGMLKQRLKSAQPLYGAVAQSGYLQHKPALFYCEHEGARAAD